MTNPRPQPLCDHPHSSVEAARRLTLLYLGKASERAIIENEPLLHAEVMNTLGNLWFALLPYMPPVSTVSQSLDPIRSNPTPLPIASPPAHHQQNTHPHQTPNSPSGNSSGGSSRASASPAGPTP